MKWKSKLLEWKNGKYPKHPNLKKSFFWETSPVTKKLDTEYKEKYIISDYLNKMEQNFNSFENKINSSSDNYAVAFYNLSQTSLLVIPIPRKSKKYTTLKDFMDNASDTQQKKFWKKVAGSILLMLKSHDKVWVSTHGKGVPYLHVRIDIIPKYYLTKNFK